MAAEVIMDSPAALQVRSHPLLLQHITRVLIFSAALSANLEQHCSREQQHYHLPNPH